MTEPVLRSAYWLFTESQLEEALDAYVREEVAAGRVSDDGRSPDALAESIKRFLCSRSLVERGMRDGNLGEGLDDG